MARQKIIGLSERDARILKNKLREWDRFPRNVIPLRGDPRIRSSSMRLARTTSTGTYPTRADGYNAWELEFVTVTFSDEPGPQALTITGQGTPYIVARNVYNDPFVPSGTLLEVWNYNSRWWFEYEDEIQAGTLKGTLTAGGSVDVAAQKPGGGDQPGGWVRVYDKLGVMTGDSGKKCLFKWQREHAQYWLINLECDNSVPSTSPLNQGDVLEVWPRWVDWRERRLGLSDLALGQLS